MEKSHKLHKNKNGTISLQHVASGEVMHSSIGPEQEARLLYAEQSQITEKLMQTSSEPLVLFDIGLGAATNALACIQKRREIKGHARPLHVVSFENDLTGLDMVLENHSEFPFFEGMVDAVTQLRDQKHWVDEELGLSWKVHTENFEDLDLKKLPSPEIIFFDFYSPKTSPQLWREEIFKKIFEISNPKTTLFTYSSATRIRVSMLLAGFFVGSGASTGAKNETTVAAVSKENLSAPLGERWLLKFIRSDKKYPYGWTPDQEAALVTRIQNHPQFTHFGEQQHL